jgi:hypothetical protein
MATFTFAERPGAEAAFYLHCEVQGRNSNAVLVDARGGSGRPGVGDIVACAYQAGALTLCPQLCMGISTRRYTESVN